MGQFRTDTESLPTDTVQHEEAVSHFALQLLSGTGQQIPGNRSGIILRGMILAQSGNILVPACWGYESAQADFAYSRKSGAQIEAWLYGHAFFCVAGKYKDKKRGESENEYRKTTGTGQNQGPVGQLCRHGSGQGQDTESHHDPGRETTAEAAKRHH